MPRTAQSNGIKPYLRALAVIKLGVPVSPQEINDHVGTGDYAAKYISKLRTINNFMFTIQKDGRKVVSYTLIQEPANAAELRNLTPKVAAPKTAKVVSMPAVKAKVAAPTKAAKVSKPKMVAAKKTKIREYDDVTEQFGTSGEIASAYSVDADWDSIDNLDLSKLI